MRSTLVLIFSFFVSQTVSSQLVEVVDWEAYERVKSLGQQPVWGTEAYENGLFSSELPATVASSTVVRPRENRSDNCSCLQDLNDGFSVVPFSNGVAPLYRSDDGVSPSIALPFNFCLYGETINSVQIGVNGFINFGLQNPGFSANPLPVTGLDMAVPFWADLDTRSEASGVVHYKLTEHALIVVWDGVSYYPSGDDLFNTFQVILTDGTDPLLPEGRNIGFCYGDIQFGGAGFGGDFAIVGVNPGGVSDYISFGGFSTTSNLYEGPEGLFSGFNYLDNLSIPMLLCPEGTQPPVHLQKMNCGEILTCANGSVNFNFIEDPATFSTASISLTSSNADLPFTSSWWNNGQLFTLTLQFGDATDISTTDLVITALDAATGDQQFHYTLTLAGEAIPPTITGPSALCTSGQIGTLSIANSYENALWSNGASGNAVLIDTPGTYSVSADFGTCLTSATYTVAALPEPQPIISGDFSICQNETTTLSVTQPFTAYFWSNNTEGQTATVGIGNHSVSVIDANGCIGSTSQMVTAISSLIDGTIIGTIFPATETEYTYYYTIENASSYTWTVDGGVVVQGAGTNFVTVVWLEPGNGSISVTYTDTNGCESDAVELDTEAYVGVDENNGFMVQLYPNPTSHYLNISVGGALIGEQFQIFNATGALIYQGKWQQQTLQLDVQNWASGLYFCRFNGTSAQSFVVH
jgi:hypothetical protein